MSAADGKAPAVGAALDEAISERFRRCLDAVAPRREPIGLAVSGGPDSLALLILAAAARPGEIHAATVDHGLRPDSASEAKLVAGLCAKLGVEHSILTVEWEEKPETGLQAQARQKRYALLSEWASEGGIKLLATAHHLDDQAETFLMRLNRGAGVRGLASMRPLARAPVGQVPLARPLLGWRRSDLEQLCAAAGLTPAQDPSNSDEQFERARMRSALAAAEWLDPVGIAASAAHLAQADAAVSWASALAWRRAVRRDAGQLVLKPRGIPREIRRRLVMRAVARLASEGGGAELRGSEVDRLLNTLAGGGKATIRGVMCVGGEEWRFAPAPARS